MSLFGCDGITDPLFQQRFFTKVKTMENGCDEWTGAQDLKRGYGKVWVPELHKLARVTRVAYAIAFGPFPQELDVCHHCDNPRCVNPKHLFLGTASDNLKDCSRKGRLGGICTPERNGWSKGVGFKLSEQDVLRIRSLVASGVSRQAVAEQYRVGKYTIRDIVQRRTWKFI